MKNLIPKFGSNRLESYVEFLNNLSNIRFGLEGTRIFYYNVETETKVYITDSDGYIVIKDNIVTTAKILDSNVTTIKILDTAVTAAKLAATLDLTGKAVKLAVENSTPVNAVSAQGTLTLTGVVKDGEIFTVGDEIFEIDTDGVVTSGNIAIDVSAFAVGSQGTLTVTGGANQIADTNTIVIDTKIYEFKTTLTPAEGEILIGANDTAALLNLKNALDLGGTPGTDYSCAAVHPTVKGVSSDALTLIVEARTPGTAGDSIATTITSGAELSWGDPNLGDTQAGVDCPAADADGIIVTDASAGSTLVTATQGGGTTVIFTVDIAGVLGNAFASTVTLTNGTFGDTTLGDTTLGVDGTVGALNQILADATNLYIATAINTVADANWKKLVLQSL